MKLRNKHALRKRAQAGAAYAEALIILPVFIVLFGGVLFFHSIYSAKLEAKARAREAVWRQSRAQQCSGVSARPGNLLDMDSELAQAASATAGGYGVSSLAGRYWEFVPSQVTTARREVSAWSPSMMSSNASTLKHGQNKMMCNEHPHRTPSETGPIVQGIEESGVPDAVSQGVP